MTIYHSRRKLSVIQPRRVDTYGHFAPTRFAQSLCPKDDELGIASVIDEVILG